MIVSGGENVYPAEVESVMTSAYLRVEPAKNNQAMGGRWAMDYEVIAKSE